MLVLDFSPGTTYLHVSVGRDLRWKFSAKFTHSDRDLLTTLAIEHDGPSPTQGYKEAQAGSGQLARAGRM